MWPTGDVGEIRLMKSPVERSPAPDQSGRRRSTRIKRLRARDAGETLLSPVQLQYPSPSPRPSKSPAHSSNPRRSSPQPHVAPLASETVPSTGSASSDRSSDESAAGSAQQSGDDSDSVKSTSSGPEGEGGSDDEGYVETEGVLMRSTDTRAMSRSVQKLLAKAKDGSAQAFEEGRAKRLQIMEEQKDTKLKQHQEAKKARIALAKQWHVIPTLTTDLQRERALRRTATKGVVTLFNAKSKHQRKAAEVEKAGPAARNPSASLGKGKFFEMLRGDPASAPAGTSNVEGREDDLGETIEVEDIGAGATADAGSDSSDDMSDDNSFAS